MPRNVVIVGAGFGGLTCAQELDDPTIQVTLIDRRNHHLFQPLLYQVATAALNPSSIATPIRRIFREQRNVSVLLGEVREIDIASHQVRFADGSVDYDDLVIATGATHSYFGKDHWATLAPGLKSIEDALEIRRRVFLAFEAAERCEDEHTRKAWLTFVVVGGGATGVELAGALAEISRYAMDRDFRSIDPKEARVILVEASQHVLAQFAPALGDSAREQLKAMGVEVRTGTRVNDLDPGGVIVDGERIPARTALWAAGVAGSPLAKTLGCPLDKAGRVLINPDLTVPGHPEIQVIGDLASLQQDGKPLPGVAPAAMQMGRHAAANIRRRADGNLPRPFVYFDKGSMATIGKAAAVADIRGMHLKGVLAWFAWLFVHILFIIGFRNRFLVLLDWAWSYIFFERGARLITGPTPVALLTGPRAERRDTPARLP